MQENYFMNSITQTLSDLSISFETDVNLSHFTYFKTGGIAKLIISPCSIEELKTLLKILKKNLICYKVVGETTNLMFLDGEIYSCIVSVKNIANLFYDDVENRLVAECGALLSSLSRTALLYGYGGFEISLLSSYRATTGIGWLENGGVYVLANIRGGGEFGPRWHQAALKENRQRAYDDFIAVAEDLISRGITSPQHLGIQGGSNGGLLMGVMLTQRPDLFGAIVCQVPLLDMKRYNKLLAGASWMDEYGNPDTDDWEFISKYSPYQNFSADADYPLVLFTTSTRDDRVHPGHARKMVARMQSQGHEVLYYENIEGGHGGAANNEQSAYMRALAYTFLWQTLATQ